MEYLIYFISSLNIVFCVLYTIPKFRKIRSSMFISLVAINSVMMIQSKLDVIVLLIILALVFEIYILRIDFDRNNEKNKKSKKNYAFKVLVLLIVLVIGFTIKAGESFALINNININGLEIEKHDLVLVFLIVIITFNSLLEIKKWNG